ncbi:MAG: hypothetical protein ABWX84_16495 [Nocardioides sp.]
MTGPRMRTAALLVALFLGVAPAATGAPAVAPADPVDLGGTPVEDVSTDPQHPAPLTAGLWSDVVGPRQQHEFSYERTDGMPFSTVHIGVVGTSQNDGSDQLEITAETPDGTSCGSDSSSPSYLFPDAPFGAEITLQGTEQGDLNGPCLRAKVINFSVGRGLSDVDTDLPVAIKIVEEAALEDPSEQLPAAPEEEPPYDVPRPGTPDDTTGADSFEDAPLLDSGTYADTGDEGEVKLYRVSLDWGQTLAVRMDVPTMEPALAEQTSGFGPDFELTLFNPMRNTLDTHPEADASAALDGDEAQRVGDAAGPVRYLSRYGGSATYLPGDYWIAVAVEPSSGEEEPISFPYELTVEVQGEAEGAPAYDRNEPFLVGEDSFSTVASGNPAPQDDEAASDTRRLAALGLGLFGLACCGLGTLRLRRR